MKRKVPESASRARQIPLDDLIAEITEDAYGDGEQLWAFRQAFEDQIAVPLAASIVGEPVTVVKFDFDGNERRGLTAKCRRADGSKYVVSAADVALPDGAAGAQHIAAYRKWMGLAPHPRRAKARPQTAVSVPELDTVVELAVLSVKPPSVRCRVLGSDLTLTLRAPRSSDPIPGEILSVRHQNQWTSGRNPYLSGTIESKRIDAQALGLVPLALTPQGYWNPLDEYWADEGEPVDDWAKPIIARGSRPEFEMEQVLPGADPEDMFSDPIIDSTDRAAADDFLGARKILNDLCQADLRCLDAHAHLGNLIFDRRPEGAIRHYEVGFRIGELSLGKNFDGLLPWGWIDNRPFLRCMNGFGLCLWRLSRFEEAYDLFVRMLGLNPRDNQGARFLIDDIEAKRAWEDCKDKW